MLALFGFKMFYDGYNMSSDEAKEELEAANEEVNKANEVHTLCDMASVYSRITILGID